MRSPQHKQDEEATSIIQRLVNKKELTYPLYNGRNKTAQNRRLNEFYKKEKELSKENKNG